MPTPRLTTLTRRVAVATALLSVLAGCATVSTPVNVTDTIANTPELSTLHQLITSAQLADTLGGTGPFTLFAPSNDAFKAVPAKTMDALAKDPAALKNVLAYHVVQAKALAADVKNSKVKSMNGAELELAKAGDFVTIGEHAIVTKADLVASNGVVHIIDAVLMPPAKK